MAPTTKTSARAMIATAGAVAMLGFSVAIPTAASAETPAPRGDAGARCAIPAPPMGAKKIDQGRSQGVLRQTYKSKKISAYQTVLYYKDAGKSYGYKTKTWGGGTTNYGSKAGSGWGVTMRNKACGYLKIDAGSSKGQPTYFFVCRGKTEKTVSECSYYG